MYTITYTYLQKLIISYHACYNTIITTHNNHILFAKNMHAPLCTPTSGCEEFTAYYVILLNIAIMIQFLARTTIHNIINHSIFTLCITIAKSIVINTITYILALVANIFDAKDTILKIISFSIILLYPTIHYELCKMIIITFIMATIAKWILYRNDESYSSILIYDLAFAACNIRIGYNIIVAYMTAHDNIYGSAIIDIVGHIIAALYYMLCTHFIFYSNLFYSS